MKAENRIRSTAAPAIIATVMMAKVSWKMKNRFSGKSPAMVSGMMPLRPIRLKPPTKALSPPPSEKARL